jgi:hypothetical protein
LVNGNHFVLFGEYLVWSLRFSSFSFLLCNSFYNILLDTTLPPENFILLNSPFPAPSPSPSHSPTSSPTPSPSHSYPSSLLQPPSPTPTPSPTPSPSFISFTLPSPTPSPTPSPSSSPSSLLPLLLALLLLLCSPPLLTLNIGGWSTALGRSQRRRFNTRYT